MICDLAQYYHILDYTKHSPFLIATLVYGLDESSRIKRKINEVKVKTEVLMLGYIAQRLDNLIWAMSGAKSSKKPKELLPHFFETKKLKEDLEIFNSGKDFREKYNEIIGEIDGK